MCAALDWLVASGLIREYPNYVIIGCPGVMFISLSLSLSLSPPSSLSLSLPLSSLQLPPSPLPLSSHLQMCFLKGRTSNKHEVSHKVIEISMPSKGHKSWRRRLLGLSARQENGRHFDEPCEPFVFTPRHALIRYVRRGDEIFNL